MTLKLILENIVFLGLFTVFVRLYAIGGAINAVFFYPKDYQQKAIERGLTDEASIKKHHRVFLSTFIPTLFIILVIIIGAVNNADTFTKAYLQSLLFLEVMNIYYGIAVDKIWVGYSKLWRITGMEDVPYVQTWKQVLIKRGILALIWIPFSAVIAGLALLVNAIIY